MSYVFRLMSSRLASRVSRPFAALALGIACALSASAATTVTSWSGLKETLRSGESVALGANISQDSDTVALDGNQVVELDLNGFTLTRHKNYRLFHLNSSTCQLTICDTSANGSGKAVGTDKLAAEGGLVLVEKGHLIVNGGEITGKVSTDSGMGGFASVKTDGRITINGGTIKSCEGSRGGAFYMSGGTLTINGGTISGCTTPEYGGAVYAYPSGSGTISITMNGGKITGCSATNAGGGFDCTKTTLAINGGTITSCSSNYGGAYSLSNGSTLTMNGGVVTKCSAKSQGAVFNKNDGTITVNGGVFDDSNVTGQGAKIGTDWSYARVGSSSLYAVSRDLGVRDGFVCTGTFAFDPNKKEYAEAGFVLEEGVRLCRDAVGTYTLNGICVMSWSELTSALSSGTNAVFGKDIGQQGGELTLPARIASLDLRGHVLTASSGNRIFRLNSSNSELTISDSSVGKTGTITRSDTLNADGGLAYVENGNLVLKGGTITGKTSARGGVAYVSTHGCFTISGGTVTNCTATEGAAIYVAGGTAEMTGGTIAKGEAASNGGAIRAYYGTVKMSGGTISSCKATWGGAIYIYDAGLTMAGGTIRDCSASLGGAFYVDNGNSPTVSGGLILKSAAGDTIATKYCTVTLKGGVFDNGGVTSYSGVDLGSGLTLTGISSSGLYVIGSNVVVSSEGNLGGGTFSFDPAEQIYKDAGLKLASSCSSRANGDGTYTVAASKEVVSVANWSQLKESLLLGASVRLSADIAQDSNTVYFDGNQIVTLDLNGHTLTRHKDYWLFCLRTTGCQMTIDDTSVSGAGKVTCTGKLGADGGLVFVEKGHLVLENGTFTGKTTTQGGFAFVNAEGRVTMNGGTITASTSDGDGGAFYVNGGTLTMNGGTISSCESTSWYGGAMRLYGGATVTVNGGRISSCKSKGEGGVFYVQDSRVTLNGGVCSDTPGNGFYCVSGNIFIKGGVFDRSRSDGTWRRNVTFENPEYAFTGSDSATHYVVGRDAAFAGDSKLRAGTFTFDPRKTEYDDAGLRVASYASVTPNADATYTVSVSDPVLAESWQVVRECLELGMNVTLAADVEASGTMCKLQADCAGKNLVLDLNGHVITHTAAGKDRFLTFYPEAANCVLTIRDSSEAKTGAIVHAGEKMTDNGGCLFIDGQKVILESGTISGFASSREGAGVVTYRGGIFEMKGGAILDCKTDSTGAAVYVYDAESTFAFIGGVISNCTKSASAGSALANHGTTHLAGGLIDDVTVTNASNNVTFETGCSFVGTGTGLYVIGRDPIFSNGQLIAGTFFFDPADPLYAASGLVLADFVWSVGLRDGTWRITTGIERDSLIKNGSFERGTAMPPEGEACPVAGATIMRWTGGDGATVFTTGWAATNDLTVLDGEYAVRLEPGATITQQFEVVSTGYYLLSVGYCGTEGAVLHPYLNGKRRLVVTASGPTWRRSRHELSLLYPGIQTLVLSNATDGAGFVAIDDISISVDPNVTPLADIGRVVNSGFETGATMPITSGASTLAEAAISDWTGTDGTYVYGALATNDYPSGAFNGDYALALDNHASVSQYVLCTPLDDPLVLNGVTGRWYAVSFSYGAQTVGPTPTVRLTTRPLEGGDETVLLSGTATADGAWSSLSKLAFLPAGTNVITVINDSNEGRAVVDDVTCEVYVQPKGDLIFNGGFAYGSGLPPIDGYERVAPDGRAEPSVWSITNTAFVFGRKARQMTRAGVLIGQYGLALMNGARAEQTFQVTTAGTYRVGFVIAERLASAGDNHPTVTVSVDGEALGTVTAYRHASYDAQILFCDLEPGSHVLSFEAAAGGVQALLLDAVSVRLKPDLEPPEDVTGITPAIRILPEAATQTLLAKGVELSGSEIDTDSFEAEDFATTRTTDYFRLESHAGVYAHPEYRPMNELELLNGFTLSLGGLLRGGDGPLVSFEMTPVSQSDVKTVLTIESRDSASRFAFVAYPVTGGVIGEGNEIFSVAATNLVAEDGVAAHFAAVWRDGEFSFYANGRINGTVPFAPGTPFTFDTLRLGAFPAGREDVSVDRQRCGKFDLSDVRVYATGLSDMQVAALAASVCDEKVTVTLYDPAQNQTFGSERRSVGSWYGTLASAVASRPGYQLIGWKLLPNADAPLVTPDTVITKTEDHYLYAEWSNFVYTVTYDFAGYPFAENRSQTIAVGEAYVLPSGFEVEGVAFRGWTNALGQAVAPGAVFPVGGRYEDETFYADYDNCFATVVFEPHNGQPATTVDNVLIGSSLRSVVPADPVRPGYTFLGWFDAESGGQQLTDETRFANYQGETWHAQWQGDEQAVSWRAPEGCRAALQMTVSRSGEAYLLPEEVPVYTNELAHARLFYGWGRDIGTNGLEVIAVYDWKNDDWLVDASLTTWTNAHDVVALWWTACPFDANGGLLDVESTWLYPGETYGTWMKLPTPARTGYAFDGWRTNDVANARVSDGTVVTEPLPTALVAGWTPLTVRVTLDANDGTTNENPSVVVEYDRPYGVFPTPTRPGYALASWHYLIESGFEIKPETIVSNSEDHTAVASWTNAWYSMTYRINGIDGASFQQRYENPWPALAVPTQAQLGEHGVFKGWLLEETREVVAEGQTATMTHDGTLIALIAGETCTITLDAVDGILDADSRTLEIEYQTEVEGLPEAPDVWRPNCTFLGWYTQDGLLVTNGTLWIYSGTTPLQARWKGSESHTVTYERNSATTASPVTCHELCYGDDMPTVAPPARADGASFLGWFFGSTPCTDSDGKPLSGYERCPWENDVTLTARWSMPRNAFAQAEALEDGVTNTVVGVLATDEPGEPNHDLEGVLRATHWYTFTETAGTPVRIVFEDLTDKEPCVQLAVYAGTDLTELVKRASLLELDEKVAVLEWTPVTSGTCYLALAQGRELDGDAALAAYRISATGIAAAWTSAWTDPSTMPGDTPEVRVYNALRSDGFSDGVATRLSSPTNAYVDFCAWAQVGKQGSEVPPDLLCDKTNVILAAAYGLTSAPEASVEIVSCESASTNGVSGLRATLRVTGACTVGGVKSEPLLKAALGLSGSSDVKGTYSDTSVDCVFESCDAPLNEVTVLATPKKTGEIASDAFFLKGVTY